MEGSPVSASCVHAPQTGPHGGPGVDGMAQRCFETAALRAWRLTVHVSAVYFPAGAKQLCAGVETAKSWAPQLLIQGPGVGPRDPQLSQPPELLMQDFDKGCFTCFFFKFK